MSLLVLYLFLFFCWLGIISSGRTFIAYIRGIFSQGFVSLASRFLFPFFNDVLGRVNIFP
ncbi:hypothetical protein K440DRAFT_619535 [Wilcoxina mikolae CBS 423.85]|nr:hypothetical protein K440DRAFT_619535 [Wilcoxina mikolae CBS 423.85]